MYASHLFGSYLSLFGLLDQNSGDLSYIPPIETAMALAEIAGCRVSA